MDPIVTNIMSRELTTMLPTLLKSRFRSIRFKLEYKFCKSKSYV